MKMSDIPQLLKSPVPRYVVTDSSVQLPLSNDIQKVRFYPSGMVPSDMAGLGIWVKYKKNITQEVKVLDQGSKWIHIDTPDRELFLSGDHLLTDMDRPLHMGFDKFVAISSVHQTGNDQINDRFLINPHSLTKLDMGMGLRDGKKATRQLCISDSGGFQLRSGVTEFIDPSELCQFYNENADEGITLDIPSGGMPRDIVEGSAQVQIYNSDFLKRNLDENVALSNVVHGVEIHEMKWYKEYIENYDSDFPIVSFPSSMDLPGLKQLDRLAFLLSHGAQYSQYHMLGLFNIAATMLCVRLAHKLSKAGREIFITSDAATAYYSAKWRVYHTLSSHLSMVERHVMGKVSTAGNITNPYRILACSCEVCSNVKYVDVMMLIDKLQAQRLIVRHNEVNYTHWLSMCNIYAHELDDKDYKAWCLEVVGSSKKADIVGGLDYIEILLQDGWSKAHKKYAATTKTLFGHSTSSLFDGPESKSSSMPEIDNMGNVVKHTKKELTKQRLAKAIKRYMDFYK